MRCNRFLTALILPVAISGVSMRVCAEDSPDIERHYSIRVELFSVQSDSRGPIKDSYRVMGSGSASPEGRLGLGCGDKGFGFNLKIHPTEDDGQFFVDIELTPEEKSGAIKPRKERLAMGDLKPVSLELAADESEKRSYRVTLTPFIEIIDHAKRKIDASTLNLDSMNFAGSAVIVDSWRYAGKIHAGGTTWAFVNIPGYARIDFALQPFRDAQSLGSLQDGTLTIRKPGGTPQEGVVIDNVQIGRPPMTLPGGPYEVWARWSPAPKTVMDALEEAAAFDVDGVQGAELDETAKAQVRARVQELKEFASRIKESDFGPNGPIQQIMSSMSLGSGGGPIRPQDQLGTN